MIFPATLTLSTRGRGTYDLTAEVARQVAASGLGHGLCHCFLAHTSASLILCENADPSVRRDLEAFLVRLIPDGDPRFEHQDEGPDDMPAHLRAILTRTEVTVPVRAGRLALGTWQGLYLYEHRTGPHTRRVLLTISGAPG